MCRPGLTFKNIGTPTWGHVWTHTLRHTHCSVLLPPACCWNCFPPSSEPGKAGFIVLTYLCVKSDCGVLYLCLYSDGETERASEGVLQEREGLYRSQTLKLEHLAPVTKSCFPLFRLVCMCNIYYTKMIPSSGHLIPSDVIDLRETRKQMVIEKLVVVRRWMVQIGSLASTKVAYHHQVWE